MTVRDVVIHFSQLHGLSQRKLAEMCGYKHPSAISNAISKNDGMDMKVSTMLRIFDALSLDLSIYDVYSGEECDLDNISEGIMYEGGAEFEEW